MKNFYKYPFPSSGRYIRLSVYDKLTSHDNTEEGCLQLEKELNELGVETKVACNLYGMWSIAILGLTNGAVFLKMSY